MRDTGGNQGALNGVFILVFVHQEDDSVEAVRGHCFLEYPANLAHRRSLGGVRNDDILVVKLSNQFHKFIDVHMSAGVGPVGVLINIKGAFGYEDFAFGDIIEL